MEAGIWYVKSRTVKADCTAAAFAPTRQSSNFDFCSTIVLHQASRADVHHTPTEGGSMVIGTTYEPPVMTNEV